MADFFAKGKNPINGALYTKTNKTLLGVYNSDGASRTHSAILNTIWNDLSSRADFTDKLQNGTFEIHVKVSTSPYNNSIYCADDMNINGIYLHETLCYSNGLANVGLVLSNNSKAYSVAINTSGIASFTDISSNTSNRPFYLYYIPN